MAPILPPHRDGQEVQVSSASHGLVTRTRQVGDWEVDSLPDGRVRLRERRAEVVVRTLGGLALGLPAASFLGLLLGPTGVVAGGCAAAALWWKRAGPNPDLLAGPDGVWILPWWGFPARTQVIRSPGLITVRAPQGARAVTGFSVRVGNETQHATVSHGVGHSAAHLLATQLEKATRWPVTGDPWPSPSRPR